MSQDLEKARSWQKLIREAARSGLSIREFCRRRRLRESQFYRWQRRLKEGRRPPTLRTGQATFALVSEEPGDPAAGIELVLANGCRIRISRGADEATLRVVLAAAGQERC
jgi:transposase-like protein